MNWSYLQKRNQKFWHELYERSSVGMRMVHDARHTLVATIVLARLLFVSPTIVFFANELIFTTFFTTGSAARGTRTTTIIISAGQGKNGLMITQRGVVVLTAWASGTYGGSVRGDRGQNRASCHLAVSLCQIYDNKRQFK